MPRSRKGALKKPKTRKRSAAQDEGWYTIRRILDERTVKGRVEYLVDWDDNIVTGQAYDPTWSSEVTTIAREEWERVKAQRLQEPPSELESASDLHLNRDHQQQQQQQQNQHPPGQQQNCQEQQAQQEPVSDRERDTSQSPQPAHRRRLEKPGAPQQKRRRSSSSDSSSPSPIRPRKVPKSDTCGSLCDELVVSLVSSPSLSTPSELPELPDVDFSEYHTRATSLVVEIPKNSHLNPADYLSVLGSQSSGKSTQSLAELENEDSRVSIVRPSQGTIPDSQGITDRSWTQHPLSNASLPPSLIEPQPLDASPDSSSRVIPDSLEDHSKETSEQLNKATEGVRGSLTSNFNSICGAIEDRIQASHESGSSDIPSHQPDHLREVAEAHSPAGSISLSHNTTPAPCAPQPLTSLKPTAALFTQSDSSPRFLTQPFLSLVLEPVESSVSSRVLESPAHPAAESTPVVSSSTPSASDPGVSQAAQIIPRDFESPSQPLTGSESQEGLSKPETIRRHQPETRDQDSVHVTSLWPGAASLLSLPAAPAKLVAAAQAKPATPLNPYKSRRMDNETPEQAAERRRRTLDAELSEIFSIDAFDTGPASAPHTTDLPESRLIQLGQTLAGAPEEHAIPAAKSISDAHTELPVHSSDPHLGATSTGSKGNAPLESVAAAAAAEGIQHDRGTASATRTGLQASTPQKAASAELADIYSSPFVGAGLEQPPPVHEFVPTQQSTVTVSLADISRQPEPAYKDIPLVSLISPDEPLMPEHSADAIHLEEVDDEHSPSESSTPQSVVQHFPPVVEHTVTLPFQASLRQKYNDIIVEFKTSIKEFNRSFSDENYSEPNVSVVNRIDELFNHLLNLCDYPENIIGTDIETLPPAEQAKYCCDANPKFNFIFELLSSVEAHSNILVVARSPDLLRLLCHLAEALKMHFSCDAIGKSDYSSKGSHSKLVLALSTDVVDTRDFDIVIGYDHSFRHSVVAQALSTNPSNNRQQLVLVLVTTHSIEHIDLSIPDELTPIERKSVLVSAIVRARNLVASPDRGYHEPHEIASVFIEYLTNDQDAPLWEPTPVPESILDVYVQSQSRSQMPIISHREQEIGRKRKHTESDDSDNKRLRVTPLREAAVTIGTGVPPLSDEVRALLDYATPQKNSSRPEVLVNVRHTVLQSLAEKFSEFERRLEAADCGTEYKAIISGLDKRIKEYERTTHKVYESQRVALQDRSRFEMEKRKIEAAMQSATEQSQKEAEKAKKRILELEATVARLTEDPNASDPQDTPLAKTEKLLEEAQAKIAVLEKRLENAREDADYIRNLYQDAASTASGLKSENTQLRSQNEDLGKKAAENSVRIHEIQERNTVQIYLDQIAEHRVQIREREFELDRAREELRQLKNGRRETRQSSVPRSPRMGMMSPRTVARPHGGGPASRGASPAAGAGVEGMQFYGQQPGNGRWDHLRG